MKKILFLLFILSFSAVSILPAQQADVETEEGDGVTNPDFPQAEKDSLSKEKDFFSTDEEVADDSLQHEFVIAMAKQNLNLDPHYGNYTSEAQILDSLYDGLFSYDPKTLEPVPALAASYKISRDKKRWTFTLRENASFSNGELITAYSVRNAWLKLLKSPGAPYASLLDCIKNAEAFRKGKSSAEDVGIIARNNTTLVVQLESPTAHLSRILCHHAFAVCTDDLNAFSGAFVLKEKNQEHLILEKNEKYWDAEKVKLPKITIAFSDDIADNAWKYNTGKIDWISGMVDTAKILNGNSVRISAIFGTEYLFFSCKNKPWNNPDFRNALMAAVPWNQLRINSLVKASTLVYPLAGYPAVEGLMETSAEDALEMMEDARKAADIKKDKKLKICIGIQKNSERMRQQAEILRNAWEPLGVELEIQTTSDDRYIDSIASWNADIFSYSWIGDFADPLAFLELFRTGSTLNQTKWDNKKFDELLDLAGATNDTNEHYKILAQAEQLLLDEGVILPIAHSVSLHAINLTAVGGWYVNALDIHPYKYLFFKKTAASTAPNII